MLKEDQLTFPSKAICERCEKIVPYDETWTHQTFSPDEGMTEFRICTECNKEKGNQNIHRFVWEFRQKRKILRDSGFDDE